MGVLQLLGVIALCATVIEAGSGDCFRAKDECPNDDITFWLQKGKKAVKLTEANILKMEINPYGQLKVIIHGYEGHKDSTPNTLLVQAYMEKKMDTIIIVDWGKMAKKGCYHKAISNIRVAGKCTATLLNTFYWNNNYYWMDHTHIIGFGLGAHVAGIVGNRLRGLGRITGLDPIWLGFSGKMVYIRSFDKNKLDPTDARLVDVYHSNSGWKGTPWRSGDLDFYLNNGQSQPGCETDSCSHHRSVEVFAESINSQKAFYGKPCELEVLSFLTRFSEEICPYDINKTNLIYVAGENVKAPKGTYKIATSNSAPFANVLQKSEV